MQRGRKSLRPHCHVECKEWPNPWAPSNCLKNPEHWFTLRHQTTEQKIACLKSSISRVQGEWFLDWALHHVSCFLWHRCQKSKTTFNMKVVLSPRNCSKAVLTSILEKLGWCISFSCCFLRSSKLCRSSLRIVLIMVHFTSNLGLPSIVHLFVPLGVALWPLTITGWVLSFYFCTLLCPPLPGYGRVFLGFSAPMYSISLRLCYPCSWHLGWLECLRICWAFSSHVWTWEYEVPVDALELSEEP